MTRAPRRPGALALLLAAAPAAGALASIARPVMELRGFARVRDLRPGQSRDVTFRVPVATRGIWRAASRLDRLCRESPRGSQATPSEDSPMTSAGTVVSAEETIPGPSGLGLHVRTWRPTGTPRAVVVVCHGFNSHSGQYRWVGEQFANAGFAVTAADLRGRGRSEGERFYVADVADYVADLALAVARAKARDPGLPTFLLGHSAGGVVSGVYCLDHQEQLTGFICESFAFRVPAPRPALAAIKGLSRLAPRLGVLRLKHRDFSRIPEAVAALEADPLTAGETQPASTVAALVRADERLEREFPRLTLPVLILHGSHDRATLPRGSRMFHAATGSADKTLRIYEGHFHDLLNDRGREDVLADILGWIEARVVPA